MKDVVAWLWDVELDAAAFQEILLGQRRDPPRDRKWALLRLIEYAPYHEIRRLLPLDLFLAEWPTLAQRVRSRTRREGMQFFYEWHRERSPANG